jgi:hypothetical protein
MAKPLLKKIGIGLLLIPLGFLLLFTVGEIFSGDLSGLSHLIQAAPLLLIIFLAFKKPLFAGILLSTISFVLGIMYIVDGASNLNTIMLVEAFLFLPPFISGILLILSSKKK